MQRTLLRSLSACSSVLAALRNMYLLRTPDPMVHVMNSRWTARTSKALSLILLSLLQTQCRCSEKQSGDTRLLRAGDQSKTPPRATPDHSFDTSRTFSWYLPHVDYIRTNAIRSSNGVSSSVLVLEPASTSYRDHLYVIDGSSGVLFMREAVSGTVLPDGSGFVYGREYLVPVA